MLPVMATLTSFFTGEGQTLSYLWQNTFLGYLRGSILLCFLVAVIAGGFGLICAVLVSVTDFPGRRLFAFLLAMPFAVPAYIMAYCYGDFLSPFGGFANILALGMPREQAVSLIPAIKNLGGAALILGLSVYPYVYLAVRADLTRRSSAYFEAAISLGATPMVALRRVILPGIRAACLGGLALALMEAIADYGVSDYFGVQTLSTGIFRTWYGLGDLTAAAQIAGGLFLVAVFLLLLELAGRRGQAVENIKAHRAEIFIKLPRTGQFAAMLFCSAPVILGFFMPFGILLEKLLAEQSWGSRLRLDGFFQASMNTSLMAASGAILIMGIAIFLAYWQRRKTSRFTVIFIRIMTMGYAIPGSVIAVGILSAGVSWLSPVGLNVTSGGLLILLYAYLVRFLTAGFNVTQSGFEGISTNFDMAARNLGASRLGVMGKVHWPLGRGSLLAGSVIVFIDISRELPATLLLRPFNFETLASQVYRLASDERLATAAPAALMLILTGLIPTFLLALLSRK